ncbi:hypothetical protein ABZV76_28700 [Streptomyces tendae]|uniref:hypothetical protein n=1 Tax=Streptomyces tendae TaxID=1932 RepID=UPI0033B18E81
MAVAVATVVVVVAARTVAVGMAVVVGRREPPGQAVVAVPVVAVPGRVDARVEHARRRGRRQEGPARLAVPGLRHPRDRPGGREQHHAFGPQGTATPHALGRVRIAAGEGDLDGGVTAVLPHQPGDAEEVRVDEGVSGRSGDQKRPVLRHARGRRPEPAHQVLRRPERFGQHGPRALLGGQAQQGAGGVGDQLRIAAQRHRHHADVLAAGA